MKQKENRKTIAQRLKVYKSVAIAKRPRVNAPKPVNEWDYRLPEKYQFVG